MAHIKVQRRSMRPEEWTDIRFAWLKRHIYQVKWEITNLQIRDALQIGDNEFKFLNNFRPLQKGDMYFTPDGNAFIQADVNIPADMQGKELWLSLKTAAEICVKINGKYVGGVDPNRERMLISPYVDDTQTLHIEMQGYNRSKPDDERNPESLSVRGCRQIFEGAYISIVNHKVQDLVYDFELFLDIAKSELFNEDYRNFLNRELNNCMNLIDFESEELDGIDDAKEYMESVIYTNDTYKGNGDVALIAHSHLDLAYYWRKLHTVQKNLRTMIIQLRLMDRYPDFIYTHTQPYIYETLEENYPEVFEELKEKVANGQFEPVGAMYVEPDCNIPNAESLIRQCLYGQMTYKRMFGEFVNNAWLPDVFGNSWILPQILKKSGVEYFVSNKMSTWNDTNRFPHNNFKWRGIDGSEVLACVPPTHFITWNAPSQIQENWEAYIDKDLGGQTMNMFGYGDGGSGCTEEMIELMHRFNKVSVMPKCEHIGGAEFLERNLKSNDNLATWDGELYLEMHRGTFTTKARLKKYNRQLEQTFRLAEIIAVAKGDKDYQETITGLYKKFLVNQFHDILPGSHIYPVYEDAIKEYDEISFELNKYIDTACSGEKYFNPLNFAFEQMVFIEDENASASRMDKSGYWSKASIPALSCANILPSTDTSLEWVNCLGENEFETPYYIFKLNPDGSFVSLFDKELKREWVKGDFNKIKLYDDRPGNYDAWDILPNYKDKQVELKVKNPVCVSQHNCDVITFLVEFENEKCNWKMYINMFNSSREIIVDNKVDWHEKHRLAKVEFGTNLLTRKALCDTSAGFVERDTHKNTTWQQARFEVCHHNWCDMSESDAGIAIINNCKYGVTLEQNVMSLSLLRGTIRPDVMSDMGEHSFNYMILPHKDGAVKAEVNKKALMFNAPLKHIDKTWSYPTFEPLYLQAAKFSEDGKMLIFRLCETDGCRGTIKLDKKAILLDMLEQKVCDIEEINYSPFEIITIGVEL